MSPPCCCPTLNDSSVRSPVLLFTEALLLMRREGSWSKRGTLALHSWGACASQLPLPPPAPPLLPSAKKLETQGGRPGRQQEGSARLEGSLWRV